MNLLGKLYYVYHVFYPDGSRIEEILISRSHDDYLGYGTVQGIFRTKREADEFATQQKRRLKAAA